MSSFDEMRILQKEADLAKKKLQEVENAGKTASKTINESIRDISSSMDDFRICLLEPVWASCNLKMQSIRLLKAQALCWEKIRSLCTPEA